LPDGLFFDQKSQFWLIFLALQWKIRVFLRPFWYLYVHFVYFTSIWYILR
jgi:hypothetical protein